MIEIIADELNHIIFAKPYKVTAKLVIQNPTLYEIGEFGEQRYWQLITTLVSRPYDAMVKLDDMGINYQQIPEYTFFLMQAMHFNKEETSILFGDFDFQELFVKSSDEDDTVLISRDGTLALDKLAYIRMVEYIRHVHFLPQKVEYDVGNEFARKHLIESTRRKEQRAAKKGPKPFQSILSDMISSKVNLPGSNYTYDTIQQMHISQLYDGYMRTNKILHYNQVMSGVYAGTVAYKELDKNILDWSGNLHI